MSKLIMLLFWGKHVSPPPVPLDGEQQVGDDEDGDEAEDRAVVVLGRDERGSVLDKRKKTFKK